MPRWAASFPFLRRRADNGSVDWWTDTSLLELELLALAFVLCALIGIEGLKAKKCVWLGRVYRDLPAHPCWIPLPSSGLNAVS
jgi:hypothetical protein